MLIDAIIMVLLTDWPVKAEEYLIGINDVHVNWGYNYGPMISKSRGVPNGHKWSTNVPVNWGYNYGSINVTDEPANSEGINDLHSNWGYTSYSPINWVK